MKIGKVCLGGFLVLAFLSVFAVGVANAQFPDLRIWQGRWFKLSMNTTENVFNGVSIETHKIKSVIYLDITAFIPPATLAAVVWEENDAGTWVHGNEIGIKVIGGTEFDFLCAYMQSDDSLTNPQFFAFSARVTGKPDIDLEDLKSATFKTLGGSSWEQNLSLNSEYFISGFSLSGKLIDVSKLPFTP